MTAKTHTPTPWLMTSANQYNSDQWHVIPNTSETAIAGWASEADARRIVACVNACAGMQDPVHALAAIRAALVRARNFIHENSGVAAERGVARDLRLALALLPKETT